jgi:hypothetical protein
MKDQLSNRSTIDKFGTNKLYPRFGLAVVDLTPSQSAHDVAFVHLRAHWHHSHEI